MCNIGVYATHYYVLYVAQVSMYVGDLEEFPPQVVPYNV